MPKGSRKGISPSLRWSVFARDGFSCRYCGAQAGQEGVELVIDHVISVVDGGDNRFDNLVTACNKCNGGKSGRSLHGAPAATDVINRIKGKTKLIRDQAKALADSIQAAKERDQQITNIKCAAYDVTSTSFESGERTIASRIAAEFGADTLMDWYRSAAENDCPEYKAVRYICGCAKRHREGSVP